MEPVFIEKIHIFSYLWLGRLVCSLLLECPFRAIYHSDFHFLTFAVWVLGCLKSLAIENDLCDWVEG